MIRGVAFNRQTARWRATLSGYGRRGYIGEYLTETEAVAARRAAEVALHGQEHADPTIIVEGEIARIPLIGRQGVLRGWALIDAADLPLVEAHLWSLSHNRYAVTRGAEGILYLHRLILPGEGIADHISGDSLDCRRANLRPCTAKENSRNARLPKNNTTGFKGVRRTAEGRFQARITVDYREIHIGNFDEPEEAARAYDDAARHHFGTFARLNFTGVDIRVETFAPQAAEAA